VADYSRDEQRAAAGELATLGANTQTGAMIADYGRLRDEARALCR
jgi:hypothetical protein